ncbi:stage II sporulation protein D [Evansella vedderi]|uniref:Stage II sporulation protein D n=1 Tax=Evansella vedderi TaxID=38282 RepID=A0ABU0A2N7_9BACI|nr:stage II sporulation protein D [Evansella vedderi]MDQ0257216.1 stage II sporulation protein D [Evansella vedderi]
MKQITAVMFIFIAVILVIPSLLVVGFSNDDPVPVNTFSSEEDVPDLVVTDGEPMEEKVISVFRTESETIEEVPLEEYIAGVVAREMDAAYEMEALKAQALTARTYIINLLLMDSNLDLPDGADVLDTVQHQVYSNEEEMRERWGTDFDWKMARIKQAVYETQGQIITYNGEPITASFFSTSNGFTENSEEYWTSEISYLRSVESPWDRESPRYEGEASFSVERFEHTLGVSLGDGSVGNVLSRTTGGRVAKIEIGGQEFTGREIRELLELDSTDFTIERVGDVIEVETRGWGHGVGMSQFGAHGMAQEGFTYDQIIKHYYQGVEIQHADSFLGSLMAAEQTEGEVTTP